MVPLDFRLPRNSVDWKWLIRSSLALVCLWVGGSASVIAGNLVVSPHPSDDVIIGAGVVYRSVGVEEITVVYVTNGDGNGVPVGLQRQGEAVSAQTTYLGTTEDVLIFLGYPDTRLREIFNYYQLPTSQYCTPSGQCVTYGNRGLGRSDYHAFRFGAPAAYNYANIVADLRTVVGTYRPNHIYTSSEYDAQYDYKVTYRAVKAAVAAVRALDPSYAPVIHSTIVWSAGSTSWPAASDPAVLLGPPPGLTSTPLEWSQRESLDVPEPLQNQNLLLNPKFRAVESYASMTRGEVTYYTEKWPHKDEIFWAEGTAPGNTPPIAEAGPDITTTAGSTVILDGSRSRDPDGSPLTFQWTQRSGPAVVLDDPAAMYPRFAVPGSLSSDQTWSFDLLVSDGALTSATDTARVVAVVQSQNIASQATATASSESTSSGQLAASAINGVIGGSPELTSPEWRSSGERAGAWIRLTWPTPVVVDRARLYDRPNALDQITSAVLSFSDGSTVSVGALDNDARTGTSVAFQPRTVTSVTLTVTGVSGSTTAVGLAEFQVFGRLASQGDAVSPSVPGNLAVSGVTSSSISLSWSASSDTGGSGLAGYRIYRDGSATPLTSVTGTSFTDGGPAAQGSHSYQVSAYDVAGNESAVAGPVTGTTLPDTAAPSVPGNLAVSGVTSSSISLSWSASTDTGGSGLAGYRIYRDGSATPLASVTGTSFTDGGLAAQSSHSYQVSAYDGAGNESAVAGPVTGTTLAAAPADGTAPSVPGTLAVSGVTSSSISLSWSASTDTGGSGLAGYRIYKDGSATPLTSVTGTSFTDGGLAAQSSHSYQVSAYDGAGNESAVAGAVTGTTLAAAPADGTAPSVPGTLAVSGVTSSSISLRWSASTDTGGSGLAGYRIYRDGSATPLTSVTGTSFTDGGLAAQSSHSYQVSAYDVAGNVSAAAGPVTGGTLALPDTAAPSVPGDLAVGGTTSSSISLNWSASSDTDGSGLAGYRVYRDGVLVGTVARAAANVMTFNSIASSEAILTSTTVDGFLFSSEHFHLFGDGYYASNGTTHMTYESGRGYPITMSRVDGGTFSLLGFDGAEAVTTSPKDRPAAEAIAIDGFPSGGGTVHVELVLDGITDGGNRNTANDFQGFSCPRHLQI